MNITSTTGIKIDITLTNDKFIIDTSTSVVHIYEASTNFHPITFYLLKLNLLAPHGAQAFTAFGYSLLLLYYYYYYNF